jgi:hypothetical protein
MNVLVARNRVLSAFLSACLTAGVLALAGCGGDEEEAAAVAPPPPPGSGNRAPTISGSPLATVMQNVSYSFTPTASDPDGDPLTFSIANRPSWASFSPSTGRLAGTPSAADVATYNNITITVSDGTASASLNAFSVQVVGTATGSATLSWLPPTQNTDGTPLTNLSGYRVYWGTSQGSYPNSVALNNPGLSSYVVNQLTPATWFFTVTAVASTGAESAFSNIAQKVVQ